MSNTEFTQVWGRGDFAATLADFNEHADKAVRVAAAGRTGRHRAVTAPKVPSKSRLFAVSRERKARLMDALAVVLLLVLMACLGAVVYAASAHADNTTARAWAAEWGPAVCDTLDTYPSIGGVAGSIQAIEDQGATAEVAGERLAYSVSLVCPRHLPLLRQFVAAFGERTYA